MPKKPKRTTTRPASVVPPAKITVPRPGPVHPRERLFRLLDRGDPVRLVWVSGPAGSGKTTTVAGYLQARRGRQLWYQLDARDSDPAGFFYYLRTALQAGAAGRRATLPLFTPEYALGLPAFARNFFEAAGNALAPEAVLVFDDWQEVRDAAWLVECLLAATAALPPGVRIVVISREEPPAALAPLRARRALVQIGWQDLRLRPPETRAIVRLLGATGSASAERLHDDSGGWVAGLVLMLAEDRAALPSAGGVADAASAQFTFDYFAAEVFGRTDPETRGFLLTTALLPYLDADTAAALSGDPNAGRILADLAQHNYFTFRRGAHGFQYHPLFRQFLLTHARAHFADADWNTLQRRAAAILAGRDLIEEAGALMQAAADHEGLAGLITQRAAELVGTGRFQMLAHWLTALPPPVLESQAWLSYWAGIVALPVRPNESLAHFDRAFAGFETASDLAGAYLACAGALEAVFNGMVDLGQGDPWMERVEAMMQRDAALPSPEIDARVAVGMLLLLMWHRPLEAPMSRWAAHARKLWRRIKDIELRVQLGYVLVLYHDWMGRLPAATTTMGALRELAGRREVSPLSRIATRFVEGHHGFMCADDSLGAEAVADGLAVAERSGVHVLDPSLIADGIYLSLGHGDLPQADRYFARMAGIVTHIGRPGDHAHFHALAGWRALLAGDTVRAHEEARTAVEIAVEAGMRFPEALSRYGLALALGARGEHAAAARELDGLGGIANESGSAFLEYMHGLGRALSALDRREPDGIEWLRRAMAVGRKHGMMQTFWWHAPSMARLCATALEHGVEPAYVRELIERRRLTPPSDGAVLDDWPWPVRVFTLGRLGVQRDGRPLDAAGRGQRKPIEMLTTLIALGGREVAEEQLSERLWPDADGDAAHRTFKITLHRLRKLLGDESALVVNAGRISINPQRVWIDCREFERALAALESSPAREPAALLAAARRAARLYRGPFLAREPENAAALGYRERLRAHWLRVLRGLIAALGAQRACDEVIELHQLALEVDDLAEEFYQGLMRCYLARGRRAEALRVYRRARTALAAVGVEPAPATVALHEAARSEAIAAAPGCEMCRVVTGFDTA
jgi:DNA-binding SARP family transcriptional activator